MDISNAGMLIRWLAIEPDPAGEATQIGGADEGMRTGEKQDTRQAAGIL
jgi:hypothetical protein